MSKQPQRWIFRPVFELSLEQMTWILAWDAFEEDRALDEVPWVEIEARINKALIDHATFTEVNDILDDVPAIQRLDLMEWAADQIQRAEVGPDFG